MEKYVVLDIETTGLFFEAWDEPIEVCAIKYIDGQEEIFHEYIRPYRTVPKKVEELTKITNKFLETKKNKYKVLPELRSFIGDCLVIGHNASAFDVPFLNFWFNTLNLPLITKRFCTMKSFKKYTGRKNGKLCDALDYYSIVNNQAHSALEDTRATYKLFKVMSEQNDISQEIEEYSDYEAYVEIMKRVCKSRSHAKIKDVLCDAKLPEKQAILKDVTKEELYWYFSKFQTPLDVYSKTSLEYNVSIEYFRNWLNNINASKFYKYFSDTTIYNFTKSIINRCNTFDDVVELHKKMYQTEDINLFYYTIVYRLEKESAKMVYTINDFDYYFSRGVTISEIATKAKLTENEIIEFFTIWAEKNKVDKKDCILNYIVGKKGLANALQNGPSDIKEKVTLALYEKKFFNI